MTSESKANTEPWVAKHKAEFPYAYDPKGTLQTFFKVSGIPHAVLVDPTGKIVWSGHPGSLKSSMVESAVAGALPTPMWEWSGAAKGVRAALTARQFAKALEAAGKLSEADQGPVILAAIKSQVAGLVTAMKTSAGEGNFLDALESAKSLSKDLAGLPEAQEAQAEAARLEGDKEAQRVIAGQKKVRKIRDADPRKKKDIEKAIGDLEQIEDQYTGTHAAKEAAAFREQLVKKRNSRS